MAIKTIPVLVVLALAQPLVNAQETISSGGGFLQNPSGSVSATIGEPVSETFSGNTLLTQGMQQPSVTINQPIRAEDLLGIRCRYILILSANSLRFRVRQWGKLYMP